MDPLVSVSMITYNNAKYIKGALEGFVHQQINFPAEVVIYDDGSTDGTQDILREYEKNDPKVFNIIYQKENQASKGVNVEKNFQAPRLKGKYIALCDPVDYWFHIEKLDLQAKYMETHPACASAFHAVINRDEQKDGLVLGTDQVLPLGMDVKANEFFSPSVFGFSKSSMMYRAEFAKEWPSFRQPDDLNAQSLQYLLISKGYFHCFSDIMGVHRVLAPGTLEDKLLTDADFIEKYCLRELKGIYEFNLYTKGEYVVALGAKMQDNVEILNEIDVLAKYPWIVEALIQSEDKIKALEEIKTKSEAKKNKKEQKKYKTAQKEYWSWFANSLGEGAIKNVL